MTGWEALFFYVFAILAVVFSILTISARNAVHSALFLISTLISLAGLYLLLQAEFLAGVQILVYVGGVLVLFLFVIMLVNFRQEQRVYTEQVLSGTLVAVLLAICLGAAIAQVQSSGYFTNHKAVTQAVEGNSRGLGLALYTDAALPFEIASVVLLVAIVGAVRLARDRKQERFYD